MLAFRNDPQNKSLLRCTAGLILPFWQFVPWLLKHGFGFSRLLLLSSVVVFALLGSLRRRLGGYLWLLPAAALLTVGFPWGLPLLIYLLEDNASIAETA